LPTARAVAIDEVAERRKRPWSERLENLKRAPQSSEVVKRTATLCETMLKDLEELTPAELAALSEALIRLVPSQTAVYRETGMKIGQLLDPTELSLVREDQNRLRYLSVA
jgi:predicted transcriptional regulator of viral defense system